MTKTNKQTVQPIEPTTQPTTILHKGVEVVVKSDLSTLTTKSSMIRQLFADGHSRMEISKILNIRYQHVRNVLITPIKTQK